MLHLSHPSAVIHGEINISGSKSESNRGLILQKLFPQIRLENLSNADDTLLLKKALDSDSGEIDIHHAGTAMRFLTAYFALCQGKKIILKGSERMHQRPVYPLVEALREQGAKIDYLENEKFPPLQIQGQRLSPSNFSIPGNISSQYITALMLVASQFAKPCKISFTTELTSRPYLEMTAALLEKIGVRVNFEPNGVTIYPTHVLPINLKIESDWSSASYWFSMVALAEKAEVKLLHYFPNSRQGDAATGKIYQLYFGVEMEASENFISLKKIPHFQPPKNFELDLNATPDIAQTIAVTAAAMKIKTKLTGLHTLKIKETDRLAALQSELQKFGVETKITDDSFEILSFSQGLKNPVIETYNDHRMAMCFAPWALREKISIADPMVVTKSYPNFYEDLEKVGFIINL